MLEDRILVWELKRGKAWAFDRLYAKYLDTLLTVAMGLLGDTQLAEDCVQDVLIQFVQSIGGFRLSGSLKGYLATCVANRARNAGRHRRREAMAGPQLETAAGQAAGQPGPVDVLIQDETLRCLHDAIQQLPFEQREIISLKIHGDLTFRDMARRLNTPLGTIQSRYRYGMERLRTLLEKEGLA
jgi:RNA polymerase sigma factor (sigma-70 family)